MIKLLVWYTHKDSNSFRINGEHNKKQAFVMLRCCNEIERWMARLLQGFHVLPYILPKFHITVEEHLQEPTLHVGCVQRHL